MKYILSVRRKNSKTKARSSLGISQNGKTKACSCLRHFTQKTNKKGGKKNLVLFVHLSDL